MIDVTMLNDRVITLNSELIEYVEEVPDTMIILTTGKKLYVKESRIQVKELVKNYKKELFTRFIDEKRD